MTEKTGTVARIETQALSGIAVVYFEDGSQIFIDSNFGARQLQSAIFINANRKIKYQIEQGNIMASFDFCEVENGD